MQEMSHPDSNRAVRGLGAEAGVSLVEVVAAMAILALALLPMLDFAAYTYNGQAYERQLAATLAAAKLEELQNASYRTGTWPGWGGEQVEVGPLIFGREWSVSLLPNTPAWIPERNWIRLASVEVRCENCKNNQPIRVVTYIAKLHTSAESEKQADPLE